MNSSRASREERFRQARAAVLGWQLALADGASVVLVERDETFALRTAGGLPDVPLGAVAAHFLRLVDGQRTVGEIIESIAGEMSVTEAVIAGKAAMAALHGLYLDGILSEPGQD